VGAESDMAEPQGRRKRPRILRRRGLLFVLLALPFVASVAGALALAAVYRWPDVSVTTYYFIVRPPFVWFAMLAPLMAFGLVALRWRWFVVGCVVWLAAFLATQEVLQCLKPFGGRAREQFWSAQMAFHSYLSTRPEIAGTIEVPLRVITWNVDGGGRDAYRCVEQLAALGPDIVLMQEFMPTGGGSMAEALEDSVFFRDYKVRGQARAILSRWPVQALDDAVLQPGLSSAWRVDVAPGLSLVCLDVHLTPLPIKTELVRGLSRSELEKAIAGTRKELTEVNAALAYYARQGPVILAGDFNLPPHYPDLLRARGRFLDCFGTNGYGWGQTAPARLPAMRPDQIYVPPGCQVYYASAIPTRWSDHYMTLTEVAVPVTARSTASWTPPAHGGLEEGGREQ
jgi:endonuclease/exonuclease/phosphatase (EEP) superfamily protein YafD